MDFLKVIIRSLKHLLNAQPRDSKSEQIIRSALKNINNLNSKKLTALRVQCLNLSKKQLIEMLFESKESEDFTARIYIEMLDAASSMLNGDLSARCGVYTSGDMGLGGYINLLAQELEEAVSQLSPDHYLFKKYKLNESKSSKYLKDQFSYLSRTQLIERLHNLEFYINPCGGEAKTFIHHIIDLVDDFGKMASANLFIEHEVAVDILGALQQLYRFLDDLYELIGDLPDESPLRKKYKIPQKEFVTQRESDGFDDFND
jgi:hypothetical protein